MKCLEKDLEKKFNSGIGVPVGDGGAIGDGVIRLFCKQKAG